MTLDEDDFYMKIIALDEIYNFVVLSFFHLRELRCSKKITDLTLLVASALARSNNIVAPHVLARKHPPR